ncbi:MAG TPA: hypothetical protein VFR55_00395 [Dehalococcoidia bacterium]|nr:hypothetical protein [Dehalococcoidia bacterium]
MSQPIALVFLGGLIVLFSAGCQLGLIDRSQNNSGPTNTSVLSPLTVTVHEFVDQRPDKELFRALVTFTNSSSRISRIFRTRKFEQLSCLLEDGQGNVIGYKNCSTGGLLPNESLALELDFKTLSPAPAQRFVVLDGESWETLAVFDVDAGTALSQPNIDADAIYASETYRGQTFGSASAWSQKLEEWEEMRPSLPDPINGANGALVATRLSKKLEEGGTIRNDKWKHCVLGAEIAASADVDTAKYAGWLREYEDLTDGDKTTSFNEIDYQATVDGAEQADLLASRASLNSGDNSSGSGGEGFACSECVQVCDQRWGDRSREWNGVIPPS